ncbi:hypothetical protein MJO28_003049 [Puccinia striiformis f. sp. tritici]|uniref:Uncharacterized protein n=1 Tax=Puccinia striiformis f. sp. tritici TaxID=168172 RepID=A0ACC0ES30_9BASI|nr:hypothetical protein MJO28_003049 [Puccinia striiformis f. sp. tritici]
MTIEGTLVEEAAEPQDSEEEPHSDLEIMNTTPEDKYRYEVIHTDIGDEISINAIQGDSNPPQSWEPSMELGHISDTKLLTNKPETGRCYTLGKTSSTTVIFQNSPTKALLDIGALCFCTSSSFLNKCYPSWSHHLLPVPIAKFSSCKASMKALGIVVMPLIFPHSKGSLRLPVELVVMQDNKVGYWVPGTRRRVPLTPSVHPPGGAGCGAGCLLWGEKPAGTRVPGYPPASQVQPSKT